MTFRSRAAAVAVLCLVPALAGCGSGAEQQVSLQVAPRAQLIVQPLRIVVGRLHPGQPVTIALRSTDARGVQTTRFGTPATIPKR